jgi:hypothetical protein
MKPSWRKGLSGAVSAIVIAVVLVGGLASASYINLTTARYNEAQMQEALRQARLGSELIRIHIHSTDGAVDSPPRITFVNAWGYESRIIELVVIARNMTPIATIDLRNRPIVLPPGSRMTLEPSQIGLSYPTFKRMADELRSIHAYTEAGNSFGSTWGFPREDNMAGRTVATTVSRATREVWRVPPFITLNNSIPVFSYTTLGPIPDATLATMKAVHFFEKAVVVPKVAFENPDRAVSTTYSWVSGVSGDAYGAYPRITPAVPDSNFRPVTWRISDLKCWVLTRYNNQWSGDNCHTYGNPEEWYWFITPGWMNLTGPTEYVEAGVHHVIRNSPARYRLVITIEPNGWNSYIQFTIEYRLGRVVINPPIDINVQESMTTRSGMIVYATVQSANSREAGAKTVTAFNPLSMRLYYRNTPYPPEYGGAILMTAMPTAPTRVTAFYTSTWYSYGWRSTTIAFRPYQAYVEPITQILPENRLSVIYAVIPPGDYTIERYYYIDSVQYEFFQPPPPSDPSRMYVGPPGLPPPRECDVVGVSKQTPSDSGGTQEVNVHIKNC